MMIARIARELRMIDLRLPVMSSIQSLCDTSIERRRAAACRQTSLLLGFVQYRYQYIIKPVTNNTSGASPTNT